MAGISAGGMNRRDMLTTSLATSGAAVLATTVDAAAFGAIGDGIADDAPAIQAALDALGSRGGGTLILSAPPVHYRLARGLKLPSYVTLEGQAPVRYPFNRDRRGICALVADFADVGQWVIEPKTWVGGRAVSFDAIIGGDLPDGVTYNCGVRNLLITSAGPIPFGGIRMHGCPGSFVEGVAIDRVGCGLLVNYCFGGTYQVQTETLYYGVAAWENVNANIFEVYCSHRTPWPRTVPAGYRLPFLRDLKGGIVSVHKLGTETHVDRPFGLLCGATSSTSTNNVFDLVVEHFPGGMFLLNAYATDFRRCYLEGDVGRMTFGIVAARSRFSIQALHAYLSGTGALFDLGAELLGRVFGSGILFSATFGKMPPVDDLSLLIFEAIEPGTRGAPLQPNIRYLAKPAAWSPLSLAGQWRAAGADYEAPAVRFDAWGHRVELRGSFAGGKAGPCFHLPADRRPQRRRCFAAPGGQIEIAPDGVVTIKPDGGIVSLDGLAFEPW